MVKLEKFMSTSGFFLEETKPCYHINFSTHNAFTCLIERVALNISQAKDKLLVVGNNNDIIKV